MPNTGWSIHIDGGDSQIGDNKSLLQTRDPNTAERRLGNELPKSVRRVAQVCDRLTHRPV